MESKSGIVVVLLLLMILMSTGTLFSQSQFPQTLPAIEDFVDEHVYVIGPYDVISVSITGKNEIIAPNLIVSLGGDIILPTVGIISVKGLTIHQAKQKLQSAFDNVLLGSTVSLTLDRPRPVVARISGKVVEPGNRTLPFGTKVDIIIDWITVFDQETFQTFFNTPVNTLSGVNLNSLSQPGEKKPVFIDNSRVEQLRKMVDLRNISIKKADGSVHHVDLIAFFLTGDASHNSLIYSGDLITVNPVTEYTPRISISGAVKRPVETVFNLNDTGELLLEMGGWFTANADSNNIQLLRNGSTQVFNKDSFLNLQLQGGDRIVIPGRLDAATFSSAKIAGQIHLPGIYPIINGETTLADLINSSGGLTDDALETGIYLKKKELSVKNVPTNNTIDLLSLLRTSNSLIEGLDYLNLEELIGKNTYPVNLKTTNPESIVLFDGDEIYVPVNEKRVYIFGQVAQPGHYLITEGASARDYINRAGGFTLAADPSRVFVLKSGSKNWTKPDETIVESGDFLFIDRTPFDNLQNKRLYEIQQQTLKNNRTGLIFAGISTVAAIVTTIVAISN